MGYERLLTAQLVVAVINIYHFVVDAYIWRLRRDPNLRTVVDQPVPPKPDLVWMVPGHEVPPCR